MMTKEDILAATKKNEELYQKNKVLLEEKTKKLLTRKLRALKKEFKLKAIEFKIFQNQTDYRDGTDETPTSVLRYLFKKDWILTDPYEYTENAEGLTKALQDFWALSYDLYYHTEDKGLEIKL